MEKLFSKNLGVAISSKDLDVLADKYPYYDRAYILYSTIKTRRKAREWMEKLWIQYAPYSDTHFISDFKKQFTQRTWELYLGCTLLNRGYKLEKQKNIGPDFKIKHNKDNIWIEARAVKSGDGMDMVPPMIMNKVQTVPEEQMILRISAALSDKFKEYEKYLREELVKDDDIYIIAINRSELGYPVTVIPEIIKCLFGVGHPTIKIPVGEHIEPGEAEHSWSGRPYIIKKGGSEVPMLFFLDQKYAGISAVLYCIDSIINSPQKPDEMGENFTIIHNPNATNPLPDNYFNFGDEWKSDGENISIIRKAQKITSKHLF